MRVMNYQIVLVLTKLNSKLSIVGSFKINVFGANFIMWRARYKTGNVRTLLTNFELVTASVRVRCGLLWLVLGANAIFVPSFFTNSCNTGVKMAFFLTHSNEMLVFIQVQESNPTNIFEIFESLNVFKRSILVRNGYSISNKTLI